jgi:hypothetical protein
LHRRLENRNGCRNARSGAFLEGVGVAAAEERLLKKAPGERGDGKREKESKQSDPEAAKIINPGGGVQENEVSQPVEG